jgi:FkbM family methyltransferase
MQRVCQFSKQTFFCTAAMPSTQTTVPAPSSAISRALLDEFSRWQSENEAGGAPVRWRRRTVWRAQLLQKLGRHVEVAAPLFFGERMRVVTGEDVSRSLLTFGYSEPHLTALIIQLLKQGDSFVDVGTHFGYEAMLAAHIVGAGGRVTCFEPHPVSSAMARKNLARFPQCEVRERAVGAAPGTMHLMTQPIERSAYNRLTAEETVGDSLTVPVTTLDAEFPPDGPRVDFFKCDAEGFELAIIEGASRMITGITSARAFELGARLATLGYSAFNFGLCPSLTVAPLGDMRVHHANVLFLPERRREVFAALGLSPGRPRVSAGVTE